MTPAAFRLPGQLRGRGGVPAVPAAQLCEPRYAALAAVSSALAAGWPAASGAAASR
jgi:hypothetical protein